MKKYNIIINEFLCNGCGDCYSVCPINASLKTKNRLSRDTAIILVTNGKAHKGIDGCDGCGVCVNYCILKAIDIKQLE
jgi:4Fe-4S ferredoxin